MDGPVTVLRGQRQGQLAVSGAWVRALEMLSASAWLHPGSGSRAGAQPAGREAPWRGQQDPGAVASPSLTFSWS